MVMAQQSKFDMMKSMREEEDPKADHKFINSKVNIEAMDNGACIVRIPRRLAEEVREKGLDLETLVVDATIERLKMDPKDEIVARIEAAENFLEEAKKYVEKGDPIQASEKLYKVAEECIKALAIRFRVQELEEAKREGRWWTKLLARASAKLSLLVNDPMVLHGWSTAYNLHVWGFHEASLDTDSVKASMPTIEELLAKTKKLIQD